MSQLLNQPSATLSEHQTGVAASEVRRAQDIILRALIGLFWSIAPLCFEIVLAGFVVLSMFGAHYALILLGFLAAYLDLTILTAKRCTARQHQGNFATDQATAHLVDVLTHVETIKAFANEASELTQPDLTFQVGECVNNCTARTIELFGTLQLSA